MVERDSKRVFDAVASVSSFNSPMLFQVEYSDELDPTYTARPAGQRFTGKKLTRDEQWLITVKLAGAAGGRAAVDVTGTTKGLKKATSAEDTRRVAAVNLAAKTLDEAGRLSLPFILSVTHTSSSWLVRVDRVPLVSGGFVIVKLSDDLRKVAILPGN